MTRDAPIMSVHSVSPSGGVALVAANVPYTNLQWTRRLSTCGSFEAQLACPLPVEWPGRYLVTLDLRDEAGVVEKVDAAESSSGVSCTVSGRFAECLWDRWRAGADGSAATGANARQAVTSALSAWHMADLPQLAMGAGTQAPTGASYRLSAGEGDSAMEAVYAATLAAGLRPLVSYDRDGRPGQLLVRLVEGVDRTRGQSEHPVWVVALSLGTADEVSYSGDYSVACSEVLAHAEQDSGQDKSTRVDRTVAVPGFDRAAQWLARAYEDVSTLMGQGVSPTAALVDAAAALRAYDHLPSVAIDGTVSGHGYLEDWDLGDLVEAELPSLSLVARERVEEVREVWKPAGHTVEATVGTKQLTRMARALIGRR